VQPVQRDGPAKQIHAITLRGVTAAAVASGAATADDVAELEADLELLAADPDTMIAFPRIHQVIGRRPPG
jgi:hypothetical protein